MSPGDGDRDAPPAEGPAREDLPTSRLERPQAPRLEEGELLARRFRIVRFIAAGGMGEVYEAEDTVLGERVALKTLRPELARREDSVRRFTREIQLARRVTHRNVCRIYDLFRHDPERDGGPQRELLFLSMELLEGETLAERLAREGRLEPAEAARIAGEAALGLAAAHRIGVVHRDLKPSNVMLVPEAGGERVVVTDFGLARLQSGASTEASLTVEGVVVGTPDYMAPEQVAGERIAPATDVYALGVVLYEMVTGERPFTGDSPLSIAVKRLREMPRPPRTVAPEVPPELERVILRCLARNPRARYRDAAEVAAALGAGGPVAAPRRFPWRTVAAGAAAAVLVAGVALLEILPGHRGRVHARTGGRPAVAVLGFRNLSGNPDAAWLSTALAETVAMELGSSGRLRTVPGDRVARARADLGLPAGGPLGEETLARIRHRLGADLVVSGSYLYVRPAAAPEGELRVDAVVQDARTGEIVASCTERGREGALLELVAAAGATLRARLGVAGGEAAPTLRASFPTSPQAARLYAEGLEALRRFDAVAALDALRRAAELAPSSPLVHVALSTAWSQLGYETRAREEAKRAEQLAASLPREQRLLIQARHREATHDWTAAAKIYAALRTLYPDELAHGLALANAQVRAGRPDEALATVAELRRLPAPAGRDPRLDLLEARAAAVRSEPERQLEAARRAERRAEELSQRLVVAQARLEAARALLRLARLDEAEAAARAARATAEAAGHVGLVGDALTVLAVAAQSRGDLPAARTLLEQVRDAAERAGDRLRLIGALANLGNVSLQLGDLAAAERAYRRALETAREIQQRVAEAVVLNNLALVRLDQGDPAEALELATRAARLADRIGRGATAIQALLVQADALRLADRLGEAEARLDEVASRLEGRGGHRPGGDPRLLAEVETARAEVRLARGDASGALALAGRAEERWKGLGAAGREGRARALAIAAEAAAALGDLGAAGRRAAEAVSLAEGSGWRTASFVELAAARVAAARGEANARERLRGVARRAAGRGMVRRELEARLELARLEPSPRRAAELERVAREAGRRGLALLARLARTAAATHG